MNKQIDRNISLPATKGQKFSFIEAMEVGDSVLVDSERDAGTLIKYGVFNFDFRFTQKREGRKVKAVRVWRIS